MKSISLACCLMTAGLSTGCLEKNESSPETEVKHLNGEEAAKVVAGNDPKPVVLDIRTPEEFAAGHIKGAINIDFRSADFQEKVARLDRATPYLLHCRSGRRSASSLKIFQRLGFTGIHHLDGGIQAWEEAGQPLEK